MYYICFVNYKYFIMGKKKNYRKEDIIRYRNLNKKLSHENYSVGLLDVKIDKSLKKHINIPNALFSKILTEKRPDLVKFTPFKIKIQKLERGGNPWLKKVTFLGIYDEEKKILTLSVDKKNKIEVVSFLWILFHEFRHHVQFSNNNIKSCLDNKNREMWLNHYDYTLNSVKHVFHEVDPLEVDANTFACEMLEIPYPNSKFSITKKTLKRLKPKEQ